MLDFWTIVGGVTADVFDRFVANALLPHLQHFNGINACSIILLDNAMIHHAGEILKLVENVGTLIYYLLPYSPDLNPIEEAFSKVKSVPGVALAYQPVRFGLVHFLHFLIVKYIYQL